MSARALLPCALVITMLGAWSARAADPPPPSSAPAPELSAVPGTPNCGVPSTALPGGAVPGAAAGTAIPGTIEVQGERVNPPVPDQGLPPVQLANPGSDGVVAPSLSNWITYSRPDCCGPVGGNGPIKYELFGRTGPVMTGGNNLLGRLLDGNAGWDVEGGGRTLFFNPDMTRAWDVELSLNYIYNQSKSSPQVPIVVADPGNPLQGIPPGPPTVITATLREVHRTFVNAGGGQEYYLRGSADCPGWRWRAGWDAGGRLGTAKADFEGSRHLTDTIYGIYTALHTDLEHQCGCCCTFIVGMRVEWDFTWSDLLKDINTSSNVSDVNFLLNLGVRF